MIVDSHCHLQEIKEYELEIRKAKAEKVSLVLTNSTTLKSINECITISEKHEEVKAAIGIHPIEVLKMSNEEIEKALKEIEEKAKKTTAIGEVGLDYKHAITPTQKTSQEEVFRKQIRIAISNKKPIVVHSRQAEKECLKILEEEKAKKVQMHWFTNNEQSIQTAATLEYYMSCGPIICYDEKAKQIAEKIPIEKMLIETDAPVMFKGKQSTPAWAKLVCEKIAEIKEISFEETAKVTTKNFNKLFT